MAESLAAIAALLAQSPSVADAPSPEERAARLTSLIRSEHPERSWKTRSVQNAAAKAVGTSTPGELQREARQAEAAGERRTRARSGRLLRSGRRLRSQIPSARSPVGGASTVRGLIAQALGLLILYWVLRTPDAITRITSGFRRVLDYLVSPRGVAANPLVIPQEVIDVAARGAGRDAGRHAGPGSPRKRAEEWRTLVAEYFPASQVDKALRVMACESEGNPSARNPTSGAAGLFQHMPQWWDSRSQAAGFAGASPYDPRANVGTAGWLWSRDGWGAWSCGDA